MLDHSYESMMPADMAILPSVLKKLNFPLNRIILMSNHSRLGAMSTAQLEHGLTIIGAFFWEFYFHSMSSTFSAKAATILDRKRQALAEGSYRPHKLYLSLNRRPRYHRIALGAILHSRGYLTKGLFSFGGLDLEWDPIRRRNEIEFAKDLLCPSHLSQANRNPGVDNFLEGGPFNLDKEFATKPHSNELAEEVGDEILRLHELSFMSLVTETNFGHNSFDHFMTEKVVKAIAYGHPFIVVGPPGILDDLRDVGYKTFSPIIDETYDRICSPQLRFEAIIRSVDDIVHKLQGNSIETMRALLDIAQHNQENFVSGVPGRVRAFIRQLCSSLRHSGAAYYVAEALEERADGPDTNIAGENYACIEMHLSPQLHFLRGFYPYEREYNGRWCSSVGALRVYLGAGVWSIALKFRKGTQASAPYVYIDEHRQLPSWHEVDDGELAVFSVRSSSAGNDIVIHSRSIFIPKDCPPYTGDERILGVWVSDCFYFRRYGGAALETAV